MEILGKVDGVIRGAKFYATHQKEIDEMIHDMDDKIPVVMTQIKKLTENADPILQRFVDAGYIDRDKKEQLVKDLTDTQHNLENIQKANSQWRDMHDSKGRFNYIRYMNDGESLLTLYSNYKSIEKRLDQLEKKDLLNIAGIIKGDHGIFGILGAISG